MHASAPTKCCTETLSRAAELARSRLLFRPTRATSSRSLLPLHFVAAAAPLRIHGLEDAIAWNDIVQELWPFHQTPCAVATKLATLTLSSQTPPLKKGILFAANQNIGPARHTRWLVLECKLGERGKLAHFTVCGVCVCVCVCVCACVSCFHIVTVHLSLRLKVNQTLFALIAPLRLRRVHLQKVVEQPHVACDARIGRRRSAHRRGP